MRSYHDKKNLYINVIFQLRIISCQPLVKMNTLSFVLSLLLTKAAFSQNANLTMNPANFPGALCNRDCNGAEPRVCYFSLLLEYYHAMGP